MTDRFVAYIPAPPGYRPGFTNDFDPDNFGFVMSQQIPTKPDRILNRADSPGHRAATASERR
jgi:hypothetical protein